MIDLLLEPLRLDFMRDALLVGIGRTPTSTR